MMQQATERIGKMEQYLDVLQKAVDENPSVIFEDASHKAILDHLRQYYESGQWLQDYALDEQGLLPQDLKRGVLAQDTLFDFFERIGYGYCETLETVI